MMVTGDNKVTANAIAREAGVDEVIANVLPAGKVDAIKRLQREGRVVAMVGDGSMMLRRWRGGRGPHDGQRR